MADGLQSEQFELPAKALAVFAIVLTSAGFLIVSLHDGSYGFSPSNPFKPHMVAAGFLFLLFAAISTSISYLSLEIVGRWCLPVATSKKDVVRMATPIVVVGLAAAFHLCQPLVATQALEHPFLFLDVGGVSIAIALSLGTLFCSAGQFLTYRIVFKALPFVALALLLSQLVTSYTYRDVFMVLLFITMASFVSFSIIFCWRLAGESLSVGAKHGLILLSLPATLFAIALFSQTAYSHIAAHWGGGKPVRISITFGKDDSQAGMTMKTLLIEESDSGLYVSDSEHSPARFIPRAGIARIQYSPEVFYAPSQAIWSESAIREIYKQP